MNTQVDAQDRTTTALHDPCFRLIYRSRSRMPVAPQGGKGLSDILRTSRTNNPALNVTGALLLYDDWFAQVLEGPEAAVQTLFDRIRADPRHDSVEVREEGAVPLRVFGRWAMALVSDHGKPDIPLAAIGGGVSETAPWRPTPEQADVLTALRDMTRGYGRGS